MLKFRIFSVSISDFFSQATLKLPKIPKLEKKDKIEVSPVKGDSLTIKSWANVYKILPLLLTRPDCLEAGPLKKCKIFFFSKKDIFWLEYLVFFT